MRSPDEPTERQHELDDLCERCEERRADVLVLDYGFKHPTWLCKECEHELDNEEPDDEQLSKHYGGDGPLPLSEQLRQAKELK